MTCEVRDGMIICSRGRKTPRRCEWCEGDAPYLCDYLVAKGRTCDRAFCAQHRRSVGPNLDYCPDHPKPSGGPA